jgi:SAM-dependent methyltransferase
MERDNEVMFWRKWMQNGRGAKHLTLRPLYREIRELVGNRKEVSIADIGSGPISTIGYTMEGVKVNYVPSDLLAEEYKELYKYHNLTPPIYPEYQDMTKMTYKDETFDIVFCRNALDHCKDAWKAIKELARICKKGGIVYMWHFRNTGRMMGYGGMHTWNLELIGEGDCFVWNKEKRFLLSDCVQGFINEEVPSKHKVIVNKLYK